MNYSITQNGNKLSKSKYNIDLKTKTFSSNENDLVLDFGDECGWTFKTGPHCTFNTGYNCTFKTGCNCIFNTDSYCTFKTGFNCTFNTGPHCTFNTGSDCTFKTGSNCTFNTGSRCVCVRRDVFEVIEIPKDKEIKLNECEIKGYKEVKEEMFNIDGKQISKSTVKEALKQFLNNL